MDRNSLAEKEKFIIDELLPYYLKHMSAKDNKTSEYKNTDVANLPVFPYLENGKIGFAPLTDLGYKWFYSESEKQQKDEHAGSYRIIYKDILSPETYQLIKTVFGESGSSHIRKYDEHIVLEILLNQLEKEPDYTERWWLLAEELFKHWDKQDKGDAWKKAGKKNSKKFYFKSTSCDEQHKWQLIRKKVLEDIEGPESSQFFKGIYNNKDAVKSPRIRFLSMLGVATSFIEKEGWDRHDKVNPLIDSFINEVSKYRFPVGRDNWDAYEKCQLVEYLVYDIIASGSESLKKNLFQLYNLPVRVHGDKYQLSSFDIFWFDKQEKTVNIPGSLRKYESCHADRNSDYYMFQKKYNSRMNSIERIDKQYSDYKLNVNGQAIEFLMWEKIYVGKNPDWDKYALRNLSGMEFKNIDNASYEFLFNLFSEIRVEEQIGIGPMDIFVSGTILERYAEQIANIGRLSCCKNVHVIPQNFSYVKIGDEVKKWVRKDIDIDDYDRAIHLPFWNKTYVLNKVIPNVSYILCHGENQSITLFLAAFKDNVKDQVNCIKEYLYEVEGIGSDDTINYKEQYLSLLNGIRQFIDRKMPYYPFNQISFTDSKLDNVATFGEEKRIWKQMESETFRYLQDKKGMDYDDAFIRMYLSSEYKGRCQLCGERIVTGVQNARFFTFRLVKKKDNVLANLPFNTLCLCPSCHGELQYGFNKLDLSEIKAKAEKYVAAYMEEDIALDDTEESIVGQLAQNSNHEEFIHPIVCNVTVNGIDREMCFSWNHFIRVAYLYSNKVKEILSENKDHIKAYSYDEEW